MNHLIGIKQGLLEQKHMDAMGSAVWLYMWMINKQTKNSKVLGGRPITHDMVSESFKLIPRRTYARYIDILVNKGYIETKRTPRGLIISVTKAKKWTESDVPQMAQDENSDVPNLTSDVPKSVTRYDKNGTSNIRDTKRNKDKQVSTDVDKPKSFGKPDINEMFDYWNETIGYKISARIQANRNACSNLLKKYGKDVLMKMVNGVAAANTDQYAPRISDYTQLQAKWNDLTLWGHSRRSKSSVGIIL